MFGSEKAKDGEKTMTPEEWVDDLIVQGAASRASDIHFDPFRGKFYVRYRIDGVLNVVGEQPVEVYGNVVGRLKILGQTMDITDQRKPQDGRGQLQNPADNGILEFRVSSFPTVFGEAVVVRFIDQKGSIFEGFEQMGMNPADAEMLRDIIHKPHGMILIAGPAGSGKTSTLYTALNQIRSPSRNITTLEDPVEFHLEFVRHAQVAPEHGFTFAEGMKAVLRQDPDVIFIGEIRDHETAEIAVRAALSGRLVFSNLSTNDSVGTVTRFLELGIPRSFLASTLLVAISKRLLRKNCPQCRQPYTPSEKFLRHVDPAVLGSAHFMKGAGCNACSQRGYYGRTPVFEFFVVDPDIVNLITEGATAKELWDAERNKGVKTLRDSAIQVAIWGETTLEEAIYTTE